MNPNEWFLAQVCARKFLENYYQNQIFLDDLDLKLLGIIIYNI